MGAGKVVIQLIEHHQITGLLQTTQGIQRCLEQQHVAFPQHEPAKAVPESAAGAVHCQHGGIEALAEAQFPQGGASEQGA